MNIGRVKFYVWDWIVMMVMMLFGIALMAFGIFDVLKGSLMGLVAIVFGR